MESIHLALRDSQQVTRSPCLQDRFVREQLAQLGDVIAYLAGRSRRWSFPIQPRDDPFDRHNPVGVEQQDREHRTLPRPAEPEVAGGVSHLDRPEYPENEAHQD